MSGISSLSPPPRCADLQSLTKPGAMYLLFLGFWGLILREQKEIERREMSFLSSVVVLGEEEKKEKGEEQKERKLARHHTALTCTPRTPSCRSRRRQFLEGEGRRRRRSRGPKEKEQEETGRRARQSPPPSPLPPRAPARARSSSRSRRRTQLGRPPLPRHRNRWAARTRKEREDEEEEPAAGRCGRSRGSPGRRRGRRWERRFLGESASEKTDGH